MVGRYHQVVPVCSMEKHTIWLGSALVQLTTGMGEVSQWSVKMKNPGGTSGLAWRTPCSWQSASEIHIMGEELFM
jgi:hypothetical protein